MLISITVSTSRNQSCKIFFCVGEILFFYLEYFASGNHHWNDVEATFFLWKIAFWLVQVNLFHFLDTPTKSYFSCSGNVFLNESFRMVETDFQSCGNCFLLSDLFFLQVRAVTGFNGPFFGKEFIPASRKRFPVQSKLFSFIPCFFPVIDNR